MEAEEGSDVDVMVEFGKMRRSFRRFYELKYFLEEVFSRDVDLVTLTPQSLHENRILREVVYV